MSGNFSLNTMNDAHRFAQANAADATATNIFKVNNLPNKDTLTNLNFPVHMGTSDPEDYKYQLQSRLVGAGGVIDGVGQAIAGPEYLDYAVRKMNNIEYVDYKAWLMNQVDWSTPEQTEYWVKMFPWMLEERYKVIDEVGENQKRMAKISTAGPQTEEDWRFLWNIERGAIKINEKPPHLLATSNAFPNNDDSYKRGMFSPMVQFIPPFQEGKTQGTAGFDPVKQLVNWSNPSTSVQQANATAIRFPNQLKGYITGNAPVIGGGS